MAVERRKSDCYCCCQPRPQSDTSDLDLALNELGMLSRVTNSRSEYLQESRRRKNNQLAILQKKDGIVAARSKSSGYQIIHIDTNFVTGVSSNDYSQRSPGVRKYSTPNLNGASVSWSSNGGGAVDFPEAQSSNWRFSYRNKMGGFEEEARQSRLARFRLGRARRTRRPYDVPGRLYHSMQESSPLSPHLATLAPDEFVSKSKSNSNSPNKLMSGPLVRSRSLDNLDIARLKLTADLGDESYEERRKIDQVSFDLTKLQVS